MSGCDQQDMEAMCSSSEGLRAFWERGNLHTRNEPGEPGDESGGADRRHKECRDPVTQRLPCTNTAVVSAGTQNGALDEGPKAETDAEWSAEASACLSF